MTYLYKVCTIILVSFNCNNKWCLLVNLITWTTALSNSVKLSHAVWGHPRWTGHGGEVWQNVAKASISALLTMPKMLTVWITINCGKFLKRRESQTTWPASWETCMQVRKQQNWTWNNRLVPNRKRSMSRLYITLLT